MIPVASRSGRTVLALLALGLLPGWAVPAEKGWPLLSEASALRFVSVKQDHLAEVHRFEGLEGRLYASGRAVLRVDLASVATGVGIRDRRMQRQLFVVERHPEARVEARVALDRLQGLAPGESIRRGLAAELHLHGHTRRLRAKVVVARRADGGFRISTRAPIVLDAREFGLGPGVAKLRRLADLDRISFAVPVTFSLVFADPPEGLR